MPRPKRPPVPKDCTIQTACRLCAGKIGIILDLGPTPLANEYPSQPRKNVDLFPLYLVQCEDCGHVQMPVTVRPERLYSNYAYTSSSAPGFAKHVTELVRRLNDAAPGAPLLEIGSNDGTLLGLLGGRKAIGVDPAINLDVPGRDGTICGYWGQELAKDVLKTHGHFGAIVALNVFAHIADIHDFMRGVELVTKKDAIFVFEVGYLVDLVEKCQFDLIYHEHQDFHSVRALVPFLKRYGFFIRGIERLPTQGGSIRVWCVKGEGKIARDAELLADAEHALDVYSWPKRVAKRCAEIREAIQAERCSIGYGATAKMTTMMFASNTVANFARVYDDNPLKIGRCTPSGAIRIDAASSMPRDQTAFLFAWNYADHVKQRHPHNKFIVPFPELRII